jgi:hypothetical protein
LCISRKASLSEELRNDPELSLEINELINRTKTQTNQINHFINKIDGVGSNIIGLVRFLTLHIENQSGLLTGKDQNSYEIRNKANQYLSQINSYINEEGGNKMAYNFLLLKKVSAKSKEKDEEEEKEKKTSYEEEEEDKDKKHGGNPFKVLMGIVGKLLDKGWNQQDITRHIKRNTKFNSETIKECVKIMKGYNRKREREKTSSSYNFKNIFAQKEEYRIDWENDFDKKSTRELIIRLKYLVDAKDFDESKDNGTRTNGIKGDLSSISGEIKKIEAALKNRGFSEKDINNEKENIKKDKYYPFETNVNSGE